MNCDKCGSEQIVGINAKCSDLFSMTYKGKSGHGYVPRNLFFGKEGYGDYVKLEFCLDCGKIQGKFPIFKGEAEEAMESLGHGEYDEYDIHHDDADEGCS